MPIYFAPMEGVTDDIYRRVHHACFGGIDKYFIPFVSPTQNLRFGNREAKATDPARNAGVPAVPQVLTREAEHFIWAAQQLQEMGYTEVNFNLGCPSGTVTAKRKGSGMLRDVEELHRFLDVVMAKSPLPVSIKTRIGYDSPEEWPALLALFAQYPVKELIIHPRTRGQFYHGEPYIDTYAQAEQTNLPLVYNGDLFTAKDAAQFMQEHPGTKTVMIGRGLLSNPALAQVLTGGKGLTKEDVYRFVDMLEMAYRAEYPLNVVHSRMREAMKYLACSFDHPVKLRKALRKAANADDCMDAARRLLDSGTLLPDPGYDPEIYKH